MERRDEANRNLLFGLLALQNGMIDQSALVSAFHAWTRDKGRSIAAFLVEQAAIDSAERSLLEGLVAKLIQRHGGDPEKSLAGLGVGPSTRENLDRLGDPELTESLATTAHKTPSDESDGDALRTTTHQIGTSTSDGRRFRVLRPHARGGLGAVFVALDAELNREVALKEILERHADDPGSRSRFVVEAEVTGGLEHPGIVPVYGLGHYDDGRPYYAMRFIRGDSLKDAIASFHDDASLKTDPGLRSLALRKLLRRFVDVCNAIDYAHGRGILHRDLKPGNIIVGRHGETLVVDWGLAKALGHAGGSGPIDERTLVPSSTSGSSETLPGQAIGTPAFMSPEQAAGDLDHLGPRSDVYSLGATLYCLITGRPPMNGPDLGAVLHAVRQGTFPSPRRVDPSIEKPLEAVCLKAMALKPEDRYETARLLADDVERWIADEPVTALREPWSVRLGRWSRRNRTKVAALGLSMATAVVLLTILTLLVGAANQRTSQALTRLRREQARTQEALDRADANFRKARQTVEDYFTIISEDVLLDEPGMQPLRAKLLRSALRYHEEFVKERGDDPAVEAELALSHRRFSAIANLTGRNQEVHGHLEESIRGFRSLAARYPDRSEFLNQLAVSLYDRGARLSNEGRREEAISNLREAIALDERILRDNASNERATANLARAFAVIGQTLAKNRGTREEAERSFLRSQELLRKLIADHPDVIGYRIRLAELHAQLYGVFVGDRRRQAEQLASSDEAITLYQSLIASYPNSPRFRIRLAEIYDVRSLYYHRRKQVSEALAESRRSREILVEVVRTNPQADAYQVMLEQVSAKQGNLLNFVNAHEECVSVLKEASAIVSRMIAKDPGNSDHRVDSALIHNVLAVALGSLGRYEESVEASRVAIVNYEEQSRRDPGNVFIKGDLMTSFFNMGTNLTYAGRYREAIPAYDQSRVLGKEIFGGDGWSHLEGEAVGGEINLAYSHREVGRLDEAERGMAAARPLVGRDAFRLYLQARYDARGAQLLATNGRRDPAEVERLVRQAFESLTLAVEEGFQDRSELRSFGETYGLANRPELQALKLDAGFPKDPFAPPK